MYSNPLCIVSPHLLCLTLTLPSRALPYCYIKFPYLPYWSHSTFIFASTHLAVSTIASSKILPAISRDPYGWRGVWAGPLCRTLQTTHLNLPSYLGVWGTLCCSEAPLGETISTRAKRCLFLLISRNSSNFFPIFC